MHNASECSGRFFAPPGTATQNYPVLHSRCSKMSQKYILYDKYTGIPNNTLKITRNKCLNKMQWKMWTTLPDIFAYSHARNHLFHCFLLAILFIAVQFCLQLKDFTYSKLIWQQWHHRKMITTKPKVYTLLNSYNSHQELPYNHQQEHNNLWL